MHPVQGRNVVRLKILLAVALFAGATSCAQNNEATTNRTVWVSDGPPVNCITSSQIRRIRVINDQTIDFEMSGRRTYRNNLTFPCSGLSFNTGIRHNSRTSQLCSFNTFTVNSPGFSTRGPACRLGQFQPMTRAPVPAAPPAP
jgi:uncharacterized metal-binding protein